MLRLGLPVAAAAIAADQISKWAARDALWDPLRRIEVTSFFNLVPAENKGISFGLFQSEGAGMLLIVGLALAISVGLGVWLHRQPLSLAGLRARPRHRRRDRQRGRPPPPRLGHRLPRLSTAAAIIGRPSTLPILRSAWAS